MSKVKKSDNLVFERPTENDFKRFYEINSDPEHNLYNPHGAMNFENARKAFDNILQHWQDNKFGSWKISEIGNPNFVIGFGGLSYRKYGAELKLNLGYRLDKNYWGKGYATQLAKSAIEHAFKELKFEEVYALVRPSNLASIKVLEKCEMKLFDSLSDVPNEENSLVYKILKN